MKKIFIILISLLIANPTFALETSLKKLSKYFKNGELIKISSYTVPGWPNQYKSIEDGSYKNSPIKVDAFVSYPKKGEAPFPVVIFAHASGGARLFANEWFKFNWNEKTGLKKILMIIFYSVLLYLINIIYWFIK